MKEEEGKREKIERKERPGVRGTTRSWCKRDHPTVAHASLYLEDELEIDRYRSGGKRRRKRER